MGCALGSKPAEASRVLSRLPVEDGELNVFVFESAKQARRLFSLSNMT
jgi:hypothetical protein